MKTIRKHSQHTKQNRRKNKREKKKKQSVHDIDTPTLKPESTFRPLLLLEWKRVGEQKKKKNQVFVKTKEYF